MLPYILRADAFFAIWRDTVTTIKRINIPLSHDGSGGCAQQRMSIYFYAGTVMHARQQWHAYARLYGALYAVTIFLYQTLYILIYCCVYNIFYVL